MPNRKPVPSLLNDLPRWVVHSCRFPGVLADRWFVPVLRIHCASCGRAWTVAGGNSAYEQQAVESCPCPICGGYTLCCTAEHGESGRAIEPAAALQPLRA